MRERDEILKKRVIMTIVTLCLIMITVAVVMPLANPEPNMPVVSIRHEAVTSYNGNDIYRMIVSASAPYGFFLFGIVMSYDNDLIRPVHNAYYTDIVIPENTVIASASSDPFLILADGFIETPDVWLMQNDRTGFSFDVFSIGQGMTTAYLSDVFAFYYRLDENSTQTVSDAFRIEDGRHENSMIGTDSTLSFVRPGIMIRSGDITYAWGSYGSSIVYREIPDSNIIISAVAATALDYTGSSYDQSQTQASEYDQTVEATPSPSPNPEGHPSPTPTPEPSSTPLPTPTPEPSYTPSPTPSPSSSPSPTPCPVPQPSCTPIPTPSSPCPVDTRPNPNTNPLQLSFLIFCAVLLTGLSSIGIISLSKKHRSQTSNYNIAMTRHKRESRLAKYLDD